VASRVVDRKPRRCFSLWFVFFRFAENPFSSRLCADLWHFSVCGIFSRRIFPRPMAPKFGNYLFRNLKGQSAAPETPRNDGRGLVDLEDRSIILGEGDFLPSESPGAALDWSKSPGGQITVRLGDTFGLMDGRVRISGKTLQGIYPGIVPADSPENVEYLISLRTVVTQVHSFLKESSGDGAKPAGPDFDTPIAQVAREDEGFFQLDAEASTHGSAPSAAEPSALTAAEPIEHHSSLPLIREKKMVEPLCKQVPKIPVDIPRNPSRADLAESLSDESPKALKSQAQDLGKANSVESTAPNPFGELPKVGPMTRDQANPASETERVSAGSRGDEAIAERKPASRLGLERLQEIFITDDYLDASQVAKLLSGLPKVQQAIILLDSGEIMECGGPEPFCRDAALSATSLLSAARDFALKMRRGKVGAITILADCAISIFQEGRVCLLLLHGGRGLLPGMRERMQEIARALDAMYPGRATLKA
jgi:hypothetical protein